MKLYDVSNNTTVIIKDEKVIISPWSLEIKKGDVLQFDHLLGRWKLKREMFFNLITLMGCTLIARIKTKILFIRLLGRK